MMYLEREKTKTHGSKLCSDIRRFCRPVPNIFQPTTGVYLPTVASLRSDTGYFRTYGIQAAVNVLVAAVYLMHVVYDTPAFGRQGGYEQRLPGTDVG
jgi:hypothetical protein